MIVQPIVANLLILRPFSLPAFAERFWPVTLFALLWLALKLSTYVRAPIALYGMDAKAFNVRLRLVESWDAIDTEVRSSVEHGEQALAAIGFQFPQRITSSNESPLSSIETLVEHPANGDLANVDAMINSNPAAIHRFITWVAFHSVFADGTELFTANLPRELVGFWPDQSGHRAVILPDVRDPAEVYRLHRSRVGRKSASAAQLHQSRGSTPERRLAFATRQLYDSRQFQIKCGYRKHAPNGYALTMRGATLAAWRRLFPWKQIIARQGRRATAEVLRLG